MNTLEIKESFQLENGKVLPGLTIAYHSYGKLNEAKDNVVWVCHALTANSDVFDWWPGVVGEECVLTRKIILLSALILLVVAMAVVGH
jgi:homoserine O-acetyltransferase